MKPVVRLTPDTTVNEAIVASPRLLTVFSAFGIDSCCGGALQIAEVARRHHIDLDVLMDSLAAHTGEGVGGTPGLSY